MFDSAPAQIRARKRIGDGAIAWDHTNIAGAIDKNAIAREEVVALIELGAEGLEKLFQLRDKIRGQIADLSAHASITGGKTRAGEQLT